LKCSTALINPHLRCLSPSTLALALLLLLIIISNHDSVRPTTSASASARSATAATATASGSTAVGAGAGARGASHRSGASHRGGAGLRDGLRDGIRDGLGRVSEAHDEVSGVQDVVVGQGERVLRRGVYADDLALARHLEDLGGGEKEKERGLQ
jgi:hypothetical protein